jgi:hypothetical protein
VREEHDSVGEVIDPFLRRCKESLFQKMKTNLLRSLVRRTLELYSAAFLEEES